MRSFALVPLTLLIVAFQGCAVVPLSGDQTLSGIKYDAEKLNFIKAGETKRSQVLEQLGPPSQTFDDIRVMTYSWSVASHYMACCLPPLPVGYDVTPPYFADHTAGTPYVLLVELDDKDKVTRFEIGERGSTQTNRSRAVAWAKAGGNPSALALPTGFSPINIPPGKSAIYVYRPGGWVPYTTVIIKVDGTAIAELRAKEYVSMAVVPGTHDVLFEPTQPAGSGSLTLRAKDKYLQVECLPDQASYLEVKVPAGQGYIYPHVMLLPENEALPTLKNLTPW